MKKPSKSGWGVFTSEKLAKDEIIEECNIIKVDDNYNFVSAYLFTQHGVRFIPVGYCSCLNSDRFANVQWSFDSETEIITFRAGIDVDSGSELFMSYGFK